MLFYVAFIFSFHLLHCGSHCRSRGRHGHLHEFWVSSHDRRKLENQVATILSSNLCPLMTTNQAIMATSSDQTIMAAVSSKLELPCPRSFADRNSKDHGLREKLMHQWLQGRSSSGHDGLQIRGSKRSHGSQPRAQSSCGHGRPKFRCSKGFLEEKLENRVPYRFRDRVFA